MKWPLLPGWKILVVTGSEDKKPAARLGSIFRFGRGSGVLLGLVQVRESGMGRGNANLLWPIGRQKRIWTGLLT